MGFFSNLFGGGSKPDIGAAFPDPPKLTISDSGVWLDQLDDLIRNYDDIKSGNSQFDALKFVFEPQKRALERAYGVGAPGGLTESGLAPDLFARSGAIPNALNQANLTGTLDSGQSNVIRSQLEAELARDTADAFANAKNVQRGEYFDSLQNLERLFPQRFEVRNIPNQVDFFNNTNQFNAERARNQAQQQYESSRAASNPLSSLFGNALGALGTSFGGPVGGALGNFVGGLFGGGGGGGSIPSFATQSPLMSAQPLGPMFPGSGGSSIFTGSGPGFRSFGNIPVMGGGQVNPFTAQPTTGSKSPTTNQQSSLVTDDTPGFKNFGLGGFGGGADFAKLLAKAFQGGF